jgi:hypothetical protein
MSSGNMSNITSGLLEMEMENGKWSFTAHQHRRVLYGAN